MDFVKKLQCFILGHKPFPKVTIANDMQSSKSLSQQASGISGNASWYGATLGQVATNVTNINTNLSGISSNSYAGNLNSSSVSSLVSSNPILTINSSPFEFKLHLCCRCRAVYWQTDINQWQLTSTSKIPDLAEAREIKKQALWEENQRNKNEVAAKLYKQYRMTLKLGLIDDDVA